MKYVNIKNGYTGIAIKDDSLSELYEGKIIQNNIGLDIFRKNWRFSNAGFISVNKSNITNNGIDLRTISSKLIKNNSSTINEIVVD